MKKLIHTFAFLVLAHVIIAQKNPAIQLGLDSTVYIILDTMPLYPGGNAALKSYISKTLNYHPLGYAVTGNVWIQFIVEKNGSVSTISVLKKLSEHCDSEALRVIRSLANWTPGIKNGKTARVKMILPVNFHLW